MSDDNWRFAEDVVKRLNKELGAYGGEVTPGVMTKAVTGVARGEELFARPELHRPWRTPSAQRHSEVVVAKEQEIEAITRKLTDLRGQVATANREIQRLQLAHKNEIQKVISDKDKAYDELKVKLEAAQALLEEQKSTSEKQMKVLKSQQDTEIAKLQTKLKQGTDAANEMSTIYMKQIDDVKAAASREVELIQNLANSRTAELSEELSAANTALRKFQDRSLLSVGELQAEARRNEQRLMDQLKEQEKRFESMRAAMQAERQAVEVQRDKVTGEKAESSEGLRTITQDLKETEQRFRDWNARLISDLDQIYDYYSAMIREVEKEATVPTAGIIPQQKVTDVYIPPRLAAEPLSRVTMDRIVERLYQLTLMKQSHANASQALMRKIRTIESSSASQQEITARAVEEKEMQLTKLLAEVVESKSRQERLEKALAEAQLQFQDLESRLSAANTRLQFFNDDLASALASPSATVSPPVKDVTFVLLSVEGGNLLWESDPQAANGAMMMLNNSVRSKMAQFGAYECFSDGTTMMLAFHDPVSACRFALETQVWLMELPWPAAINAHYNTCEEYSQDDQGNRFLVFRGLRVAMAVHSGDVEMEPTGLPTGVGESRVHYFGKTIIQALHLASLALGGQIVVSNQVWQRVKDRAVEVGMPAVTDLGDHRLTVAMRGGSDGPTTSEILTLVQILPPQLKNRKFDRQSMFDARKHLSGTEPTASIVPQLSHIRRSTLTDETNAIKSRHAVVNKAMETLQDELASVTTVIEALSVKIKDAKIGTHTFSQSDLSTQATTLDRLVSKLDVIKSDLSRVQLNHEDMKGKVKALEDLLALHSRVTLSEDDFRRRIEIVNERCNQQLYEASQQNEMKMRQLHQTIAKLEHQNGELRRQVMTAPVGAVPHAEPVSHTKRAEIDKKAVVSVTTPSPSVSDTLRSKRTPSAQKPVKAGGISPTFPDKLKKKVQGSTH